MSEQTPPPVVPVIPPAPTTPPPAPPAPPPTETPPPAPTPEEKQAFAIDAYEKEFSEKGQLSEDSYKALSDNGYPKEVVDKYIQAQTQAAAGRELENQNKRTNIFQSVGGEQQYTQMVNWASTGLSASEKQAFNTAMETGDMGQIQQAVTALKSKFDSNYGSTPNLITGKNTPAGPVGYRSQAEVVAAMSDKRYQSDPAYRADVYKKLEYTNAFNS